MGQAQLLLIVLGTVVVGLAVMAGINAYEQNNIKSDLDAVAHECMRLASDAQTAAQKPIAFGGLWDTGNTTEVNAGFDFVTNAAGTATTLTDLGWSTPGASSKITGVSGVGNEFDAICTSQKFSGNIATLLVTGITADDISITTQLHTN